VRAAILPCFTRFYVRLSAHINQRLGVLFSTLRYCVLLPASRTLRVHGSSEGL
jgi:hypothetical protein